MRSAWHMEVQTTEVRCGSHFTRYMYNKRRCENGTFLIALQMLGEDRTSENRLQFIIWINSVRFPTITLEENIKSVYEHLASQTKPLETKVLDYYRQQAPHPPTPILPPETHGCLREERIAREYIGREYDEVNLIASICHVWSKLCTDLHSLNRSPNRKVQGRGI